MYMVFKSNVLDDCVLYVILILAERQKQTLCSDCRWKRDENLAAETTADKDVVVGEQKPENGKQYNRSSRSLSTLPDVNNWILIHKCTTAVSA